MPTEDTFTSPSAWCPRPEWWHSEDGDGTEAEVTELVAAFVRALQPEVVVETGAYSGQTSQAIGRALQRNGHGHLHTVEISPSMATAAWKACAGLPVTVITGDSLTWQPPDGIGFAWIDGYEKRGEEIRQLWPHFAPGAFLGVHDVAPHHHDLRRLVDVMIAAGQLREITLHTPRGVLFAEVHQSV